MPPRQRFVHRSYDLFIRQHPVGMSHPVFAKIAHFLGDQPVAEASCARRISIMLLPPGPRCGPFRTQQFMIELANGLDRLLQLLIIAQPAAHLCNTLAPHTELTRTSSRVGHRQNKQVMPFAAGAFRAAFGVSDRALQQRATQQLAS
jgi:hypothetical protein